MPCAVYVFRVKLDTEKDLQPNPLGYMEISEGRGVPYWFLKSLVWHRAW